MTSQPDGSPSESAISRLSRQIEFSLEIDKLKGVLRQTVLLDSSRQENVAEHSWHIAVMAGLLREYAIESVDVDHAIRMLLVHDLVEIDAGDVMIYDRARREEMKKREEEAARRIFGLLPADQAQEMRSLWDEYEARETPEARFAFALDRIQPLLHNLNTQGLMWAQAWYIPRSGYRNQQSDQHRRTGALGLRFGADRRGRRQGLSASLGQSRVFRSHAGGAEDCPRARSPFVGGRRRVYIRRRKTT